MQSKIIKKYEEIDQTFAICEVDAQALQPHARGSFDEIGRRAEVCARFGTGQKDSAYGQSKPSAEAFQFRIGRGGNAKDDN